MAKAKKDKVYIKVPKTKSKKLEERAKKSVKNYGEFVEGWENQLKEIFDISSSEFAKMMAIINSAKALKLPHRGNHAHHIVPRSYYNKYNKEVDNSEQNLVNLTPQEHFIVHYYAWKSANKVMKTSMAYAFRMMFMMSEKYIDEKDISFYANAYAESWSDKSIRGKSIELDILQERYKNCIYEPIKLTSKTMEFRCRKCGNIKKIKRDNHYNYPIKAMEVCKACYHSELFTKMKYALIFIIGQDKKAYWKTINLEKYQNENGLISFKHAETVSLHLIKENCKTYKKYSFIKMLENDKLIDERHISYCCKTTMEGIDNESLQAFKFLLDNHMEPQSYLGHTAQNMIKLLKKRKMLPENYHKQSRNYQPIMIEEFKNLGYHLKDEWEKILGISFYEIENNYTIICQNFNIIKFFTEECEDWRTALEETRKILEFMEEYNSDKPNWSFDDANNRAWPIE